MTTYLVLGATGKTGRRVTAQLTAAGHHVRAAARNPGDPAPGITPIAFDWDDASTYGPALAGVDGAYVIPPALRLDHAPLIGAFAERAVEAGVGRLVLLSARGVGEAPDENPLRAAELALFAAAPDRWAVVRPAWFAQNFTEAVFAPGILEANRIVAPAGDGREPFIDADDIAAAAVAALTGGPEHAGQAYDLTGPEALSFAEAAAVLSGVTGRPITYEDVPADAWVDGAVDAGLPADYAALLAMLFGVIADGGGADLTDGVERATGRPATAFAEWAAREAGVLAAEPAAR